MICVALILNRMKSYKIGMQKQLNLFTRAITHNIQWFIWLLLAMGLMALPLVADSQNMPMASKARANHWLQSYQQAMARYQTGDYSNAYKQFRDLADFGSAGAQTMIGHLYWAGKGVPQSYGKAFLWFHRAGQRGYAPAQLALGRAYATGHGIKQDKVAAAMWLSLVVARSAPSLQVQALQAPSLQAPSLQAPSLQAPSLQAQAKQELQKITAGFTTAEQTALADYKRRWRPDVALMP
jgi:TPR repeat protein